MIKQLIVKVHNRRAAYFKLVLVLFGFAVAFSIVTDSLKVFSAKSRISEAQVRLEEEKARNEELKKELSYVLSKDFEEFQARDKLGLAREGEIVVVLPEDEILRKLSPRSLAISEPSLPDPTWKSWLEVFFQI